MAGSDVRNMSTELAQILPQLLRERGFDVDTVVITRLHCRRGDDELVLGMWPDATHPGEYRVAIPNAWGWRSSVRNRRYHLQMEITELLEEHGAYWPFD